MLHTNSRIIERAWVAFPTPEQSGVVNMCAYQSGRLVAALTGPAAVSGMTLEAALSREGPVDYAGCLCYEPMRKDKWNMALSTIAFALDEEVAT